MLALDRWGSVLVVERKGHGRPALDDACAMGRAPMQGALRVFEEATGALLEELHLFRDGEPNHHVYY